MSVTPVVSKRRSPVRALVSAALALGLVVGLVIDGGSAGPADAVPDADAAISAADAELFAAPAEVVLTGESAELRVDVLLRNTGERRLEAGEVRIELDPQPLASVADLDAGFPEHPLELGETALPPTDVEGERIATLAVPLAQLPFTDTTPTGVYLLRASSGDLATTVPLIWQNDAAGAGDADGTAAEGAEDEGSSDDGDAAAPPQLRLGLIVPLVYPDDIPSLPTRPQLSELIARWDALLDEARLSGATLAIDPRVFAAIRAYGEEAPEEARTFLASLESSALPSFALQFADADVAAQAALGFTTLLQPSNLDFVTRIGSFGVLEPEAAGAGAAADDAAIAPDESTGSDEPDEPEEPTDSDEPAQIPAPAPTLKQLLHWPVAEATAWPAEGAADRDTIELLKHSGIDSLVLDSDNVERAQGGPIAELEQGSAVITDAALGDAARSAIGDDTEVERDGAFSHLAAHLLLAALSGAQSSDASDLVLGLDRGAVGDAADPAALITALRGLDWVDTTPLAALDTGTALLAPGSTDESRAEMLSAATARESSVSELGAVLVHPEYLSGYQRTRLLELFATRYASPSPTTDFERTAARYRERDAELMSGVRAITTESTQLVGASTRVPLQLHNSLPFEAKVDVEVQPASAGLALSERRFEAILIPAEGNERVLVPVTTRVSSGESGLVVTVTASGGDLTVFTGTLPISIHSDVETIALWSLGALAALLFGLGIWRSVRRRTRGAEPSEHA